MFYFLHKAHLCLEGWHKAFVQHCHLLIYHEGGVWKGAFCAHMFWPLVGCEQVQEGGKAALHRQRTIHPLSQKSLRETQTNRVPVSWEKRRLEEGGTNSASP